MNRCAVEYALAASLRALMVLALAVSAPLAHAVQDVCVQNDADLVEAIAAVQSIPQNIHIVQGTYSLDSTVWSALVPNTYSMQPGTTIIGGYTANCAGRNIAAGNTILSASHSLALLEILGNLTFEGITFKLAHGMMMSATQEEGFNPGSVVLIYRSEFTVSGYNDAAHATLDVLWVADPDYGGTLKIIDTLIDNNTTAPNNCVVNLATTVGAPLFFLTNDTIVNNAGGGVCVRNYPGDFDGSGVLLAHDNIFYGNTGDDLYSDTPNLEIVDNTFFGYQYPTASNTVESGTLHGDPKLDPVTHRPIESPPSPAINSGEYAGTNLPGTDLDGGPRVVGTRVDRGAYESSINDAFVQTVTTTSDATPDSPPVGSLRAAINGAIANGSGLIGFDIGGGCGPHVITLSAPLPAITIPLIITGYSQPGSAQNDLDIGDDATLCVILDGATHSIGNGLLIPNSAAATTQLVVSGVAFSGFVDAAINLSGGGKHGISGNRVGGNVGGVSLSPSAYGIYVGAGVDGIFLGGDAAANRNIIGATTIDGIHLAGPSGATAAAKNAQIVNNYVGVGWSNGTSTYFNRGNAVKGIHVLGANNEISDNVVGFNGNDGIDLDGTAANGNVVEHNLVGVGDDGSNLANGSMGVRVENGGTGNTIHYNTVAMNLGTGVRVVTGLGNRIRKNSIYQNGSYGIDIAAGGITSGDNGDAGASSLGNRGQNFPLLTYAGGTSHGGQVSGRLTSTQGDYTVDIYSNGNCDGSNHGEGFRWLASATVTVPHPFLTADQATEDFTIDFTLAQPATIGFGAAITATATDANGDTSEFSACANYVDDIIFANGFN